MIPPTSGTTTKASKSGLEVTKLKTEVNIDKTLVTALVTVSIYKNPLNVFYEIGLR